MRNHNKKIDELLPPRGKGIASQLCAHHSKAKRHLAPRGSATKRKPTYPTATPTPLSTCDYRTCLPTSLCIDSRAATHARTLLPAELASVSYG